MNQKDQKLSSDAKQVLRYLNKQSDPVDRNLTVIALRMEIYYGMSRVHMMRALEELVEAKLLDRGVRWYNVTLEGHDIARLDTSPLSASLQ